MTENLIIFNTRVVTPLGFSARCGKEMEQLSIIDNATAVSYTHLTLPTILLV